MGELYDARSPFGCSSSSVISCRYQQYWFSSNKHNQTLFPIRSFCNCWCVGNVRIIDDDARGSG